MSAVRHWSEALGAWAIPEEILVQAPESPWIHPPVLFDVPDIIATSPSHERAREVVSDGASVLDVGCGGGIAAFALTPPATHVVGVDHQREMLEMFARNADRRAVISQTYVGFWPAVAPEVPVADVVTSHHVLYNVADVAPFVEALTTHARRRVVLEIPRRHPLAGLSPAWRHFWDLERPEGPSAHDALDVLIELGLDAHLENFEGEMRVETDPAQAAHYTRIRLCLPASREDEVADFLSSSPAPTRRELATLWWDV